MSMKHIILVVGSGGGGVPLIQSLQKQINLATHRIVVVEKRDFYAHWPALIRASVTTDNSIDEAGLIPLDRAFDSSVQVVRSSAKQITPTEVIVESGERIPYAQLVLATGSIWNGALALPDKKTEALEHFRAFRKRLEAADNVAIVGGGAVGIEYSGEIRHFYPHKKVTLVHAQDELVNDTYALKFRQSMLDAATKAGVEVVLGDRVPAAEPVGGYLTTEKGRHIEADFVITAIGGRPNTSVVSTLDPSVVNESGRVLVSPEFNVKLASGARNVWAIGDIIEWPEQKMVFKASTGHAPLVASNILAALKNTAPKPYTGKMEGIFVTLGPNGGRGFFPVLGGVVLGDWAVSKAKSADLFLQSTRAALGYGPERRGSGALLLGTGFLAVPVAYALYSSFV